MWEENIKIYSCYHSIVHTVQRLVFKLKFGIWKGKSYREFYGEKPIWYQAYNKVNARTLICKCSLSLSSLLFWCDYKKPGYSWGRKEESYWQKSTTNHRLVLFPLPIIQVRLTFPWTKASAYILFSISPWWL